MKDLYKRCEELLEAADNFSKTFVGLEGKVIVSKESFEELNKILLIGMIIYKYILNKKIYDKIPELYPTLQQINIYYEKVKINEFNAKTYDIDPKSLIKTWDQLRLCFAVLCCTILDYRDEHRGKKTKK